jgi:hypothetical protein
LNAIGVSFLVAAATLLATLPRHLAALPLLVCAAYMTLGQEIEVGPAHLTVLRLLVLVGFIRIVARNEQLSGGLHTVDKLMLLWAAVLLGTSAFHTSQAWVFRAGVIWTELGCYFLFRVFLRTGEDVERAFKALCLLLVPLAAAMVFEKQTRVNVFGVLGGVLSEAQVRDGLVRASGPFNHPIFAGAVGVTLFALGMAIWRSARRSAIVGCCAGLAIVYSATSSGPLLMLVFLLLGMTAWIVKRQMRAVRWLVLLSLLGLAAVMNDPVYFLMAKIDVFSGSQGYFRAQLVRSAIEHLPEWWVAGTDVTRHWMATGIYANGTHTDITNHFLAMGVGGGLLLLTVFTAVIAYSFRDVGRALAQVAESESGKSWLCWVMGALLFGFVMLFWSISLFDQAAVFFYLLLAAVQAMQRPLDAAQTAPAGLVPRVA